MLATHNKDYVLKTRDLLPILLVEDDYGDVALVKRAFKDLQVGNPVLHKADGKEALDYLRKEDTEKPCLILLDLNMPRMGGLEFLKVVKADGTLKRIPVVILTDATDKDEIVECFEFGVAGYVVKPVDSKEFAQAISTIDTYWTLSEVPYSW